MDGLKEGLNGSSGSNCFKGWELSWKGWKGWNGWMTGSLWPRHFSGADKRGRLCRLLTPIGGLHRSQGDDGVAAPAVV